MAKKLKPLTSFEKLKIGDTVVAKGLYSYDYFEVKGKITRLGVKSLNIEGFHGGSLTFAGNCSVPSCCNYLFFTESDRQLSGFGKFICRMEGKSYDE